MLRVLRRFFAEPPESPGSGAAVGAPADSEVVETLREILVHAGGAAARGPAPSTAHLLDQGWLDSLTAVDFLVRVEAIYGVRIREIDLSGPAGTLEGLARRVEQHLAATGGTPDSGGR